LRVRPIEYRELVEALILPALARLYLLEQEVRLVALVEGGDERNLFASFARRAESLALSTDVLRNRGVGDVQNVGRRSIIVLEPHQFRAREFLLEVEDVPDVGTAPAVDRLVVVADDDYVAVTAAQHLDKLELRAVRVLVLVYENELKP